MKREQLQSIVRFLFQRLTRFQFIGAENLPKEGGVLVATNHFSRLDAALLFLMPERTDITALVADKYQKYPFFYWFLQSARVIWIDRSKADFGAFRSALEALQRGLAVGIAPEGTRSQNSQLLEGKPGTVLLAAKANAPIVPVAISGTEDAVRQLLSLRRPDLTVRIGAPIRIPPFDRHNRDEIFKQYTDEIMCRIAALLPAKYHGFYKNHPRLREMLAF